MSDQDIVNAALRTDLSLFIQRVFAEVSPGERYLQNWHIDAVAHALTQVANGKIRRLVINIPPRHMKSIAASVALVAYILGHDPSAKIICASYSSDLALKLHNDTRIIGLVRIIDDEVIGAQPGQRATDGGRPATALFARRERILG